MRRQLRRRSRHRLMRRWKRPLKSKSPRRGLEDCRQDHQERHVHQICSPTRSSQRCGLEQTAATKKRPTRWATMRVRRMAPSSARIRNGRMRRMRLLTTDDDNELDFQAAAGDRAAGSTEPPAAAADDVLELGEGTAGSSGQQARAVA